MTTLIDNLKTRREAVGGEIAALASTSDPRRKAALYQELAELEKRIAMLEAPLEIETLGEA